MATSPRGCLLAGFGPPFSDVRNTQNPALPPRRDDECEVKLPSGMARL